ncbi:MAG TPA: hypothetical protein VLZ28_01615 [Daejeonella sp.]|nr:hypothetical protein [Daejeonella sp.]
MTLGTLYLIPVPLAENAAAKSFTPFLSETINQIVNILLKIARLPGAS